MKRFISFLLVAVMAISLIGCAATPASIGDRSIFSIPSTDIPNAEKHIFSSLSATLPAPQVKTLTIGGVNISQYKIVYSENPNKAKYESSPYNTFVIQDTEYDKQTAENLAALINLYFGVKLSVVKDTDVAASTYEINIGNTNRNLKSSVSSYLETDKSYVIKESSGKLIICGTSYGATWQAAEAFVEYAYGLSNSSVAIPKNFVKSDEANMLVVGCIGDSLTFGSGSSQGTSQGNVPHPAQASDRKAYVSYPAALQRIAWQQLVVYNYGVGGRTMTEEFWWDDDGNGSLETNHAWTASDQYTPCMNNAANFDLVLLMLGTNDANSNRAKAAGYNYDSAYENAFITSCTKIVNQLKAKNGDVRVVMLNCPISYRTDVENYARDYIRGYQTKAANKLGLTLLDMYTFTKNNLHKDSFPDTLHPNDQGYTIFAKGIYSMATPIIESMLGEEAQEDTTSYVTHAYIGSQPAGAPTYPVYATLAEAKTALGWGRNSIGWSYVLYVTDDITETANLGTIRGNVTIQAYSPSATLSSNPTIKINMLGDTSCWMLPDTANGNVTFKNVNLEVLEGGALYGDAGNPRNLLDPRNGSTLTLDNVILTTYETSGTALVLRSTNAKEINLKNEIQFLKKKSDGTTVPCDKIWTIDNSSTHTVNLDGAKINTTTAHIFNMSASANVTVNIKNGSELKVSTGKIFNNTGNGTFNINVSGNSLLEATADGGVIFDARGTNAVMNINVDGATLKSKSGQTFINQQVTSNGAEVSKNTTFNIIVKNATITTTSGVVIRNLSIGGTMKAYFENTMITTSSYFMNSNKADSHIEVVLKNSTVNANGSADVITNGGTNTTLLVEIFDGSKITSAGGNIIVNSVSTTDIKVYVSDSTLITGGTYVIGNTGAADATTKYNFYVYVDNSKLSVTKAAGKAIYNSAAYATMTVDILSDKNADGSWKTQILAGNGTDAANAIYNDASQSKMLLNVWGGHIETNGNHTAVLFRTSGSVANIYDGTIIADSTSAQSANMFAIQAQDSTVNIYGGHIETKTTQAATFAVRHNNGTHGTQRGAVNVYGGTIKAGNAACIGAGISSKDGQVNIYGGTFIKTGAASTYGLLGHYNTNGDYDKNYYIYGGTFITKDSADPQAYRYAHSDDMTTLKNCTGALNRAFDQVRAITVTKSMAASYGVDWSYDDYADVCIITPKGSDLKHDMFNKTSFQVSDSTTVDSASTNMRLLVEVSSDVVNNADYVNVGFAISLTNGNPADFTDSRTQMIEMKQAILYSCILANGERNCSTEGFYYAIVDINNIPNASFATDIYVRPYLVGADGTVYYGDTVSVKAIDAIGA